MGLHEKRKNFNRDAIEVKLRYKDIYMSDYRRDSDPNRSSVHPEAGSSASLDPSSVPMDRPPGVYVRSAAPDHDLDLLWATNKHLNKDERSPWFVFTLGILAGVIIAVLSVLAFVYKPPFIDKAIHRAQGSVPAVTMPGIQMPKIKLGVPGANNNDVLGGLKAATLGNTSQGENTASEKTVPASKTYKVKSGDTLGGIAVKFYDSMDPALLQKIQKANHLKSQHALKLNQELIIPAL
jgi:LysM repeat protein